MTSIYRGYMFNRHRTRANKTWQGSVEGSTPLVIGLRAFKPVDGGDTFPRNVSNHLRDYRALQLRRPQPTGKIT
jgi:hypothetical protein